MCQAIPRKVIKIKKNVGQVLIDQEKVPITIACDDVSAGDWVLVYGDVGIQKISKEEYGELAKI